MPSKLGLSMAGIQSAQFDPDAIAFLTAATITDNAIRYGINDLVTGLKLNGLWTKMQAIYPFAGSTATTQKWNLKDPRDLDAAYRLTFTGGWTHTSSGATPNGTNAYASTFFAPTTNGSQNDFHISFYSKTDATAGAIVDMGSEQVAGGRYTIIQTKIAGPNYFGMVNDATGNSVSNTNSQGFYIANRTGSATINHFKNGLVIVSGTQVSGTNTTQMIIGALASSGAPSVKNYSTKQTAFASIGTGLTASEALIFTSLVQRYQSALGRAVVAVPTVQDLDAQDFLMAAGITDSTQAGAIQNLVAGLKYYSLWSKMQAIYPFVGGTSTTHKFNLKDPFDTDAAFRLTFVGGMTHNSDGITGNGTNAYANTNLTPSTSSSLNNTHLSVYSRTDLLQDSKDIGTLGTASSVELYLGLKSNTAAQNIASFAINANGINNFNLITDSRGFFIGSRATSTTVNYYRNGVNILAQAQTSTSLPNRTVLISALNSSTIGQFSSRNLAFASIGTALTDAEASNFFTVVSAFQTQAGRISPAVTVGNSISQYSGNATTWTTGSSVPAVSFRGVAYSPALNRWIAIGISTTTAYSISGQVWISATCSSNSTWDRALWATGMNLFVATGAVPSATTNAVMTSPDGITWTNRTGTSTNNWRGMAYSSSLNRIVSVSSNGTTSTAVQTSDNGTTWTTRTTPSGGQWWGVAYSPGLSLFCVVKFGSTDIMTSTDGITWTARTGANANNWIDVAWSPNLGIFAAVSNNGTLNRVQTSPDGITWTIRTTPASAEVSWNTCTWSDSLQLFIACAAQATSSQQVMTSPDGITWTSRTTTTAGLVGVGAI